MGRQLETLQQEQQSLLAQQRFAYQTPPTTTAEQEALDDIDDRLTQMNQQLMDLTNLLLAQQQQQQQQQVGPSGELLPIIDQHASQGWDDPLNNDGTEDFIIPPTTAELQQQQVPIDSDELLPLIDDTDTPRGWDEPLHQRGNEEFVISPQPQPQPDTTVQQQSPPAPPLQLSPQQTLLQRAFDQLDTLDLFEYQFTEIPVRQKKPISHDQPGAVLLHDILSHFWYREGYCLPHQAVLQTLANQRFLPNSRENWRQAWAEDYETALQAANAEFRRTVERQLAALLGPDLSVIVKEENGWYCLFLDDDDDDDAATTT